MGIHTRFFHGAFSNFASNGVFTEAGRQPRCRRLSEESLLFLQVLLLKYCCCVGRVMYVAIWSKMSKENEPHRISLVTSLLSTIAAETLIKVNFP